MRDVALAPPAVPPLTGGLADSVFEAADRNPTLPLLARRTAAAPGRGRAVTAVARRGRIQSDGFKEPVDVARSPALRGGFLLAPYPQRLADD